MVKSRTRKMHLEVNNDVELDIRKESMSKKSMKRSRSSMKTKSAPGKLVRDARGRFAEKKSVKRSRSSMSSPGKMVKDLKEWLAEKMSSSGAKKRSSSIPKKSIKRSRSSMKNKSASAGKLVRDARGRFAEKKSRAIPKKLMKRSRSRSSLKMSKRSLKRSRSSMKRSRSSIKSKSSTKFTRDAKGRFAKKTRTSANKGSSTKKVEVGGPQKTIYMPIQQASNGKTAEAIVIKNEESAKDKADVTEVKIVEK